MQDNMFQTRSASRRYPAEQPRFNAHAPVGWLASGNLSIPSGVSSSGFRPEVGLTTVTWAGQATHTRLSEVPGASRDWERQPYRAAQIDFNSGKETLQGLRPCMERV